MTKSLFMIGYRNSITSFSPLPAILNFTWFFNPLSVGVILVHNHPSGKLLPSEADKSLTQKIKKAADFFDVKVLDYLIIIPNGNYFSFSDN